MEAENLTSKYTFESRRLWLYLSGALVLGVIYLSLTPAPIEVPVAEGDKLEHLLAYGTLMIWFSNIYENLVPRVILAIGLVAMGISLEFMQGWTGYRTFEIADMVANASGVFVGWALAPPRTPNFLRRIEMLPFLRKKN